MEKCEPGMKKCGACEKKQACEENPYRDRGPELTAQDWYGHSGLRGALMMLEESKYEALFDLLRGPNWFIMQHPDITPELNRELKINQVREEIIGMERVHRMLLGMKERKEIKITAPLRDL